MTETLANGYSSESTQRELSNEYQLDRVSMVFKKSLHSCASDKSSLRIGRVNSATLTHLYLECLYGLTTLDKTHQIELISTVYSEKIALV